MEKNKESVESTLGREMTEGEKEIFELAKKDDRYGFFRDDRGRLEARVIPFPEQAPNSKDSDESTKEAQKNSDQAAADAQKALKETEDKAETARLAQIKKDDAAAEKTRLAQVAKDAADAKKALNVAKPAAPAAQETGVQVDPITGLPITPASSAGTNPVLPSQGDQTQG